MRTGTIFETLRHDHREVLGRLDAMERLLAVRSRTRSAVAAARARAAARGLADHLDRQFATHLAAEDSALYPAVARGFAGGEALVAPLHEEHAELRLLLADLLAALDRPSGRARDEQVFVRIRDLMDLLRIHIRREETMLFGIAERMLRPRDLAALEALRSRPPGRSARGRTSRSTKGTPR
jgi:hemerythrin-like domain-containing protein